LQLSAIGKTRRCAPYNVCLAYNATYSIAIEGDAISFEWGQVKAA
jgi:hypothetical protein